MAITGPVDLVAQAATRDRAVSDAARWLQPNPNLPQGRPSAVAWACAGLAAFLLDAVEHDDPELTRALVTLTQAKDHAVRAAIADRADRLQS